MSRNDRGGFSYEVSDEQIATYSALPIDRRVRWVEEHARTTYALATPDVRARWAALRRGGSITSDARPEHRDSELARHPEAHYVLTVALDAHDEILEIDERLFDPFARASGHTALLAWIDGEMTPSAWNGDALVLSDPGAIADAIVTSATGDTRARERVVTLLRLAHAARIGVRVVRS